MLLFGIWKDPNWPIILNPVIKDRKDKYAYYSCTFLWLYSPTGATELGRGHYVESKHMS